VPRGPRPIRGRPPTGAAWRSPSPPRIWASGSAQQRPPGRGPGYQRYEFERLREFRRIFDANLTQHLPKQPIRVGTQRPVHVTDNEADARRRRAGALEPARRIERTNAATSAPSPRDPGGRDAACPADPQPETRDCPRYRGEGERQDRDRPMPRAILCRHGLAVKKRAEGCGCGAGGTGACRGQCRERDWAAGYGSAAGAGGAGLCSYRALL